MCEGMKRLIVNADGFGFTFGNNRAIMEALPHGFIRSASINVTWPAVKDIMMLVREFPHVSIGIHLNLTVGPPILPFKEIPSLVGSDGEFHGLRFPYLAWRGMLNMEEMKKELRAQVHVLREMGVSITHWDSHQGRHMYPGFFEAATVIAAEEGIRGARPHIYYFVLPPGKRLPGILKWYANHPAHLITHALSAWKTSQTRRMGFIMPRHRLFVRAMGNDAVHKRECWEMMLSTLPEGCSLIECHPGYIDDNLRRYSNLVESRERERKLFGDPDWPQRAAESGVQCISYATLLESTKVGTISQ
jgi:predicted glycoside hydrolase/deacetylase ChbG (UPF0249 family)